MSAEVLELHQIHDGSAGGKALGLARLVAMGLRVPAAFVVRGATTGAPPDGLDARYADLGGGPVAVRSSAVGEDGAEASFAGQYETVLGVEGPEAVRAAIDRCVSSAQGARAAAYRQDHADGGSPADDAPTMNVVVQEMVAARAAGVVFTADPVSARRDLLVVDAVAGLGEALVSGEATPDHFAVDRSGEIVRRAVVGDEPVLTDREIGEIAAQARASAEIEGEPLDLEWAIDGAGELYWLQARPITTLPADLNEFDTTLPRPDDVLTISNVSEMMPGAVCPLTMSITGWGIDYGLQHMQVAVGARARVSDAWQVTASAYGHLFLNLTGNLVMSAGVLGSNADQTAQSICGRAVPELVDLPPLPLWRRVANTTKLLRYCLAAPGVVDRFGEALERFEIVEEPDCDAMWRQLHAKAWFFDHAMAVHIRSSALAGFLSTMVERTVERGSNGDAAAVQAETVGLLAGATDVESAVMLDELDAMVDRLADHRDADTAFASADVADALAWLRATAPFSDDLARFLGAHGHRGYRELCIRDASWGDDPTPLIQSMQAAVHARLLVGGHRELRETALDWAQLGRRLQRILPRAHAAVRRREHTKSQLVDVAHRFKRGYRHLGELMVQAGRLPDADLVCFFTTAELAACHASPGVDDVARAQERRRALDHQQQLSFPEISVGLPVPVEASSVEVGDGHLRGRPASRGVAEGPVRVAHTLAEAAALQPGEILVTPITDIGWTPYFSLIGGLVTDLGSSVSHGAVIAREYGLPCVVNARVATRVLRTGDRVRLDGDAGEVVVLES